MNIFNKNLIKNLYQSNKLDSGTACLNIITQYYGIKAASHKIREITKQNVIRDSDQLIKVAEALGLSVKAIRVNPENIFYKLPLPAIAPVTLSPNEPIGYLIINQIHPEEVVVTIPEKGELKYSLEDFFKIWSGILIVTLPQTNFLNQDNFFQKNYQWFFGLISPQKKLLFQIFWISLILAFLSIISAFYLKFIIDDILAYNLKKALTVISSGLILVILLRFLLQSLRAYLLSYLNQKIDLHLLIGYYQYLLNLPLTFFSQNRLGEILNSFINITKIETIISESVLVLTFDLVFLTLGIITLSTQNFLFLSITISFLLLNALISWFTAKPVNKLLQKTNRESAATLAHLAETLNNIETIKIYNEEKATALKGEKTIVRLIRSKFTSKLLINMSKISSELIATLCLILLLWLGTLNILANQLTLGQLLTMSLLISYLFEPIKNLLQIQPLLQIVKITLHNLNTTMEENMEKNSLNHENFYFPQLKGIVEFKNISFNYPSKTGVLKDINLFVNPGEKIALIGPSGSGKSSLAKLLINYHSPETGDILINGYNINDLNTQALREKIIYISAQQSLFKGTIIENLSAGNSLISMEEIIDAAKITKAHDFINKLPERYNTLIEDNCSNLARGERQQLVITRALLKKPQILIFDEATNSLDAITEKLLYQNINHYFRDLIFIIITHRLNTVINCDRIYVLEQGRIIESGTHKYLMEQRHKYYDLWKNQLPSF